MWVSRTLFANLFCPTIRKWLRTNDSFLWRTTQTHFIRCFLLNCQSKLRFFFCSFRSVVLCLWSKECSENKLIILLTFWLLAFLSVILKFSASYLLNVFYFLNVFISVFDNVLFHAITFKLSKECSCNQSLLVHWKCQTLWQKSCVSSFDWFSFLKNYSLETMKMIIWLCFVFFWVQKGFILFKWFST